MARQDDCLCCRVASGDEDPPGGILIETDRWTVNHRFPNTASDNEWSGWLVLQPRRHIERLSELDPLERREMAALISVVEKRVIERLGATRLYQLSLGMQADDHLHFHLIPVSGDPLPGPNALQGPPLTLSRDEVIERLAFDDLSSFRPLVEDEPMGVSRLAERVTQVVRRLSPYQWAFLPLFNRIGGKRLERSVVAEIYTFGWLLILVAALFGAADNDAPVPLLLLGCLVAVRLADILSTQGGIILFESQGNGFVGVRSLARTVLLGLVNLAEVIVGFGVLALAVERSSPDPAFDPPIIAPGDAVLWAAGPLGGSSADPLTAPATGLTLVSLATLAFLVILVVGVFVSNLSARLEGR